MGLFIMIPTILPLLALLCLGLSMVYLYLLNIMILTILFTKHQRSTMDPMDLLMGMMRAMVMKNQTHSTLSMEFMMTITTQTSESQEKEMNMVISMENMKLLFLMAESNMSTTVLMVNMVVLSWMLSTRVRPDTQNPMEDILEVIMLNMEHFQTHLIIKFNNQNYLN